MSRSANRVLKWAAVVLLVSGALPAWAKEDRDSKVRKDRAELGDSDIWVYNDLPAAISASEKSKKPILLVFR